MAGGSRLPLSRRPSLPGRGQQQLLRRGRDGAGGHHHHHHDEPAQSSRSVFASGGYAPPQDADYDDLLPSYGTGADQNGRGGEQADHQDAHNEVDASHTSHQANQRRTPSGSHSGRRAPAVGQSTRGRGQARPELAQNNYNAPDSVDDERSQTTDDAVAVEAPEQQYSSNRRAGAVATSGRHHSAGSRGHASNAGRGRPTQSQPSSNGYAPPSIEETTGGDHDTSANAPRAEQADSALQTYNGFNADTDSSSSSDYDSYDEQQGGLLVQASVSDEYEDLDGYESDVASDDYDGDTNGDGDDTTVRGRHTAPEYKGPSFPFSAVEDGTAKYCPGSTLDSCIAVCPGHIARVYAACVTGCGNRCTL